MLTGGSGISERLRDGRVAVTGAAGFIGSSLTRELAAIGAKVAAIDCLLKEPAASRARDSAWASVLALEGVEGHRLDLRFDSLEAALDGVDVVFHLAAMTGLHQGVEPSLYRSCNVEATERLGRACAEVGVSRIIHASTSSVYGEKATGGEGTALRPISDYGRTKLEAEVKLRAISDETGIDLTILRLFSVYGPGQRPDMAFHRIIESALHGRPFEVLGDGRQVRSNTYVDDIVDGLLKATADQAAGETMNLAGGEVISLNDALATIERLTGRRIERIERPTRPGDQLRTEGDFSRASGLIGFEPRTSFEEGIASQIEWQAQTPGQEPYLRSTETATDSPGPGS